MSAVSGFTIIVIISKKERVLTLGRPLTKIQMLFLTSQTFSALCPTLRIKEELLDFDGMLRSTANIASRLEIYTQTLHMRLTEQLRKGSQFQDKKS